MCWYGTVCCFSHPACGNRSASNGGAGCFLLPVLFKSREPSTCIVDTEGWSWLGIALAKPPDDCWKVYSAGIQSKQFTSVGSELGVAEWMQLHFWLQAYAAQLQNGSWPIAHSQKRTEASMLSYSQRSSPVHCYPLRLHLPAETFRFVSHQTTCNVTMHPQVSTAFLALWFWLRVKVLPASTFCFFFFLSLWASILTLGFLGQGDPLTSFLSSPWCYIPVSGLFLSERLFTLLLTVLPSFSDLTNTTIARKPVERIQQARQAIKQRKKIWNWQENNCITRILQ